MIKKLHASAIVVLGFTGILLSVIINATDNPLTPIRSGLSVFRYFTLQSNLIVTVFFALMLVVPKFYHAYMKPWLGAVTVYITITFIVFALFLSNTWNPSGISQVQNIISHYITPISAILFLILYRKNYQFKKQHVILWMIYPLLYLMFAIIYGSLTNDYLYPFFNIPNTGLVYFTLFSIGLISFFTLLSFGTIILTKQKKNL